MDFKTKIDNLLSSNSLGVNSVSALEDYLNCGRGSINNFYKKNRMPGMITVKKILTFPRLNVTWWDTGQGEPLLSEVNTDRDGDLMKVIKTTNEHLLDLVREQREMIKILQEELKNCRDRYEKIANDRA